MGTVSRGALSKSYVRTAYPFRVRIEAELLIHCGVSLGEADFPSHYRFKDKMRVHGVDYLDYRFGDRAEALRFAERTIGVFLEPDQ